jgi:hypothetical protein
MLKDWASARVPGRIVPGISRPRRIWFTIAWERRLKMGSSLDSSSESARSQTRFGPAISPSRRVTVRLDNPRLKKKTSTALDF